MADESDAKQLLLTESCTFLLDVAVKSGKMKHSAGSASLLLFADVATIHKWREAKARTMADARIVTVPLSFVAAAIGLYPEADLSKLSVLGVATGVREDYGDTQLFHYQLAVVSDVSVK